eukprot:1210746-Rhodomonas_salina.2
MRVVVGGGGVRNVVLVQGARALQRVERRVTLHYPCPTLQTISAHAKCIRPRRVHPTRAECV